MSVVRRNVSLSPQLDHVMRQLHGVNWSALARGFWEAECRKRSPEFDADCVAIEHEEEVRKRAVFAEIVAGGVV